MDSNFSSSPNNKGSEQGDYRSGAVLVLHNDNHNTFEFVMETLEEVCEHSVLQAEQCAMIAHYNGKCEILKGYETKLKEIQDELLSRGLDVTIE